MSSVKIERLLPVSVEVKVAQHEAVMFKLKRVVAPSTIVSEGNSASDHSLDPFLPFIESL